MSTDKYYDEICNKHFSSVSSLNKHLKSASHLQNEIKKEEGEDIKKTTNSKGKVAIESYFFCPFCNYDIERKDYFIKHCETKKHNDNVKLYLKTFVTSQDLENIEKIIYKIETGKMKIGIVKGDDGKFEDFTKDDLLDELKMDVEGDFGYNPKESQYPKHIKHTILEGKTQEQIKIEKKEKKIKDKNEQIKKQEKYVKQLENKADLMEKEVDTSFKSLLIRKKIPGAIEALNKYKNELKILDK
jgi:hypothetical protein